jgi:microcystin-dependent protein
MSDCYMGEIRMFAGSYAPRNWAYCDGSLLAISQYDALFTLLGTTYGGDGQTTFALPDLRGRMPIGQGNGPGLTPRVMGQPGGSETVTLTQANMGQHNHPLRVSQNPATSVSPAACVPAVPPAVAGHNFAMYTVANPNPPPTQVNLAPMMRGAGNNLPHDNVMPGLCITFIIALSGIYPSQS